MHGTPDKEVLKVSFPRMYIIPAGMAAREIPAGLIAFMLDIKIVGVGAIV
jgi:hypothetical protein